MPRVQARQDADVRQDLEAEEHAEPAAGTPAPMAAVPNLQVPDQLLALLTRMILNQEATLQMLREQRDPRPEREHREPTRAPTIKAPVPEFDRMKWAATSLAPERQFEGLFIAVRQFIEHCEDKLRPFNLMDTEPNPFNQLETGNRCRMLNQMFLEKLPDLLRGHLNNRPDHRFDPDVMAFRALTAHVLQTAVGLEFNAPEDYIRNHPQRNKPVALHNVMINNLVEAFPDELQQRVFRRQIFYSYHPDLVQAAHVRWGRAAEQQPLSLIQARMLEMESVLPQYDDAEAVAVHELLFPRPSTPAPMTNALPAAPIARAPDAWDQDELEEAVDSAFPTPGPPAQLRPILCAAVKAFNQPHFEPLSKVQLVEKMEALQQMVKSYMDMYPQLQPHLQLLLRHRVWAMDQTAQKVCWNCGKTGHVRSHCPERRLRFATDPPRR